VARRLRREAQERGSGEVGSEDLRVDADPVGTLALQALIGSAAPAPALEVRLTPSLVEPHPEPFLDPLETLSLQSAARASVDDVLPGLDSPHEASVTAARHLRPAAHQEVVEAAHRLLSDLRVGVGPAGDEIFAEVEALGVLEALGGSVLDFHDFLSSSVP